MSGTDDELVARAEARLGTVLRGKYRLDRVLGIGGMATVYAATHRNGNEFAIKVLHVDLSLRAEIRNRFLREGHAAGSVKHPGAVQVLDDDVGEDGSAFLVMELLRGESVEMLWERRHERLPLLLVVGIGIQLLDVLEAAHARGVIHRDIKPANIFLTNTGHVKVLDFGIARIRDMAASQATQTGTMMGTPAFMSPEQAMAKTSDIDAQSDVWSAGATLFTLACGKLVHEAENAQQIMIRAATTPAPPFSTVFSDAPPLIAEVIDRALAFDKSERWSSAAAMREALRSSARAAFGASPTPEMAAGIIEELGEEATVVQQLGLPPPHPGLQHGPVVSLTDEVTVQVVRGDAKQESTQQLPGVPPGMPSIRGAPAPEVATATPVSRDTPRRSLPLWRLRSPAAIALAATGAAVVLGAGLLVVFLVRGGPVEDTSDPGYRQTVKTVVEVNANGEVRKHPPAGPSAGATPTITANPTSESSAVPSAATPTAQAEPTDEQPTAAAPLAAAPPVTRPTAPRGSATPSTGTAAKPNCTPPYYFDTEGTKHFKRECLTK